MHVVNLSITKIKINNYDVKPFGKPGIIGDGELVENTVVLISSYYI